MLFTKSIQTFDLLLKFSVKHAKIESTAVS